MEVRRHFPHQATAASARRRLPAVTIVVCATCRDETGLRRPSARRRNCSARRRERRCRTTTSASASVECLGNCKRRLTAAILRDGCWSYVFGDLDADSGPDLVAGAKLFATSTDGLMPWRGRPDSLKRGLVARIPPLDLLKDIA